VERAEFERAARKYLAECFANTTAPHVNELAARCGFSVPLFSRLFFAAVGVRPSTYLKNGQLQRAEYLLRHTKLPVIAIAKAAAYGSVNTLYRTFRDAKGTTPQQFRQI